MNDQLTHEIIGAAYKVHNTLGIGFLEQVYENSMVIELEKRGVEVSQQVPISVFYEGKIVGNYFADLLVEGEIIVELKSVQKIVEVHETQLVNYLQGTGLDIGLLINFGSSVKVKRKYRIYRKSESEDEDLI